MTSQERLSSHVNGTTNIVTVAWDGGKTEGERPLYRHVLIPAPDTDNIASIHQEKKRNPPLPNRSAAMGGREFITNPILTCVCGLVDQRFGGSAGRGAEQTGCVSREGDMRDGE